MTSLAACSSSDVIYLSVDGDSSFQTVLSKEHTAVVSEKSDTAKNAPSAASKDQACPDTNKDMSIEAQEISDDDLNNEIQMFLQQTMDSFQKEGEKTRKTSNSKRQKRKEVELETIRETIRQELRIHLKYLKSLTRRRKYRSPVSQPRRIIKKVSVRKRKPMENKATQIDGPLTVDI
ncbi:uncharacterized protein LOC131688475 [Topomyia yanbarensis]|uniref:uncharacterized protein LOC131688475 n=1 Tax=Topomyia yanbarensis TaxID=2498891 RepID=UPI00273B4366|nr:uncharacterized protein LOC131688475 [Topomyia yanbarensis]